MKKIVISLLVMTLGAVAGLFSQNTGTVQGGLFASLNVITVKCKPASDYSGTSISNVVFAIRWPNTVQYTGVALSEITSTFSGLSKEGPAWVDGSYKYQQYSTASNTAITWTSGTEVTMGTITVTNGTGTGTFELAPAGTATNPATSGSGDWYFEIGVDRTNHSVEFYHGSVSGVGLDTGLPVELISFTASASGRSVALAWKTATEINSSKFEIERSNGKEWTSVASQDAGGTSNAPKEYSYLDKIKAAVSGSLSYRLKMVDTDGKFSYSQVAEVKIVPTVYALEQNYPNPFNPETKIQYSLPADAKVSLKVYDMIGREVATVVNENQVAGYYEQKFGGYNYSSGVYFYRIIAESGGKVSFSSVKKMVMVK